MKSCVRDYLKEGQVILLSNRPEGSAPEKYRIISVVGEGGSTVCYDAIRERDGQIGKLKEFYPSDEDAPEGRFYSLERLDNCQLVPGAGTLRQFREMCDDYIQNYYLINHVMGENAKNRVLKNYIQTGDILYGCAGAGDGVFSLLKKTIQGELSGAGACATVYIWSPGLDGKGLNIFIDEIRNEPDKNREQKLSDIIRTIATLTSCVKALHVAGLMHLDVKPSNFLVPYTGEYSINPESVSMFDVNSIRRIRSDRVGFAGTIGYRAPEIFRKPDNRADIYSIGAMLFRAIVISPYIPDGLYNDLCYEDINRLLKESPLMKGEVNSDIKLMSQLANILKKCLHPNPNMRYRSCSGLLNDLNNVKKRMEQLEFASKRMGQNKMLKMVPMNERGVCSPKIAIQKMLYDYPLYDAIAEDAKKINVLVVGSGAYGQKFIDVCLEAGQMKGFELSIDAISNTPVEDCESYLQFKPDLKRFVNINGSMTENADRAYAKVNFKPLLSEGIHSDVSEGRFSGKDLEHDRFLVETITADAKARGCVYNYVFVALGEDKINSSIAKLFSDAMKNAELEKCPVCYISEKKRKVTKKALEDKLYPICIAEEITLDTIDAQLERMAFNTHISWDSSLNIDISDTYQKFRSDVENYSSSAAFALSIQYKLYSIGIREKDPNVMAKRFFDEIVSKKDTDKEAKAKYDALVALEHRRWVLSQVTEGWTAPRRPDGNLSVDECVKIGKAKNKADKTHACLVFGTEATPLSEGEYVTNRNKKWNVDKIDESLDDLDKMSIWLHKKFYAAAKTFKKKNPIQSEDMKALKQLVQTQGRECMEAYYQYENCLKNILNGVESYTKQYDYYEKMLIDTLSGDIKRRVAERLGIIRGEYTPVIEANMYRNYKANDAVLVEKIPFILTFSFQPCIAMAFEDGKTQNGRNQAVFANVAAASVLSPKQICYFYYYNEKSEIEPLTKKISAVLNYLGKRAVHCSVMFVAFCSNNICTDEVKKLRSALDGLKNASAEAGKKAVLSDYEVIACSSSDDVTQNILNYIDTADIDLYDGSTALFESAYANSVYLNAVLEKKIPYFEFDASKKVFTAHEGCDYLQFIKDESFIRINDMFSLMNAADNSFNLPEFADDYMSLWGIYTGKYLNSSNDFDNGVGNWNYLCAILEKYESERADVATFDTSETDLGPIKSMVYYLPEYSFKTVKDIVAKLVEYGVAESNSTVITYTSDSCKLLLFAHEKYEAQISKIVSQPQYLLDYYKIKVFKQLEHGGEKVVVRMNSLEVNGVNLDPLNKGKGKHVKRLVKALYDARFISEPVYSEENENVVSFSYSSQRLRKMLTSAGEILEVYTYYEALKTGYFDDVACGYEFKWEDDKVKNELDLVLTKGFKSIIVECKAVVKLELGYYHKLHSIAEHFGIGTTKVLVGNTYKHRDAVALVSNDIQRSRGNQLNIITISDEEDIMNIGEKLKNIMKE